MQKNHKKMLLERAFGERKFTRHTRKILDTLLDSMDGAVIVIPEACNRKGFREQVREAIYETALADYGVSREEILSSSRKHNTYVVRSFAHYFYQLLTGATEEETVSAFENARDRATFNYMKSSILAEREIYPDFQIKLDRFYDNTVKRLTEKMNANA